MKFSKIMLVLMLGAFGLQASAQDSGKDTQAEIKPIAPLQWQITWAEYESANVEYYAQDNDPDYLAYVTSYATDKRTNLLFNRNVSAPEYGNYITVSLEGLNLPDGKYELIIPEGYMKLIPGGGFTWEANVTQYFDIEVGNDVEIEHPVRFTPLEGNYFDVYWDGVTTITEANTKGATLTNLDTDEVYNLQYLEDYNYSKANVRIYNSNALRINLTNNNINLIDGTYRLYIPAGYVYFNRSKDTNEAVTYDFYFEAPWSEGEIVFEGPFEDGTVTVTYVDADSLEINPDYESEDAVGGSYGIFLYDSTSTLVNIPYPQNVSIDGNVITVSLNGLGISNGECQMEVSTDYLLVHKGNKVGPNVDLNAVYRFQYTNPDVEPEPEEPEIGLYPENAVWSVGNGDKVKYGTEVEVTWPGTTIEYANTPGASAGIHTPETGYLPLVWDETIWISEDETKLIIDLGNFPSGTYRVTIDEAYVIVKKDGTNYYNVSTWLENLTIDNTDSGVDGIATDNGCPDIYNINGMKLNATDEKTLPKGLYIIGGKKVIK